MAKYRLSSRNKARRRAIEILFEAAIKKIDDDPETIRELIKERQVISTHQAPLNPYSVEIAEGVAEHIYDIDRLIAQYCRGWALDRLANADLAILRCAVWEIKYNPDVDWKVAIDEAVGISRDIATDESPRFLNGILDSIRKDDTE